MQKTPLLLLPGLLCDHTVWESQIAALSDLAECTVMQWFGLDSLVAMAERTMEHAPPKFALAGHSMGGRVAFEVCRRAAERVTHLALLDTNFPPKAAGEAGEAEARGRYDMLELARTQGMRAMCQKWLLGMVPDYRRASDPDLIERIIEMFCRSTPDDFERQIRALLNRPDATPVMSAIRAKTLVMTGVDDQWSPPAAHEKIHAAIPGSKLVLVPKSGHMSTMEQPEAVNAAFREWLS
jgi:pimeloyl-ACP methyl ester carboxylesterase